MGKVAFTDGANMIDKHLSSVLGLQRGSWASCNILKQPGCSIPVLLVKVVQIPSPTVAGELMSLCHLCADELYDVGWKGAKLLGVWRCPKENANLAFLKN